MYDEGVQRSVEERCETAKEMFLVGVKFLKPKCVTCVYGDYEECVYYLATEVGSTRLSESMTMLTSSSLQRTDTIYGFKKL
jgi:hypothetical protein